MKTINKKTILINNEEMLRYEATVQFNGLLLELRYKVDMRWTTICSKSILFEDENQIKDFDIDSELENLYLDFVKKQTMAMKIFEKVNEIESMELSNKD